MEELKAYEQAVEVDSEFYDAWMKIGEILFRMKKYDEAIEPFNKALKLNPNSAAAYANIGAIYNDQKKYSEAIANLVKAVELDPSSGSSWLRLAEAYSSTGKCDKSKEAAQKALRALSKKAAAHYYLGLHSLRARAYPTAMFHFKKALINMPASDPHYSEVRSQVTRLEKLRVRTGD